MIIAFWILLTVFLYSYFGYTLLLWLLSFFKRKKKTPQITEEDSLPEITLLVAAYNEKDVVADKIRNSLELNYPKGKLHLMWVTDGSDDGTNQELEKYENVEVLHKPGRSGKTAAINRAMEFVKTPITIFCDANTVLNKDAVYNLALRFLDKKVGCVAGEKRIESKSKDNAPAAGEGFYWKYESVIKILESKVGWCMGAAGELFALRTDLFQKVPDNSIIDDFVISLTIALKGYKIDYAPEAYSTETASGSIKDEMKRKVRIASGGFQTIFAMPQLFNFFKHFMLSWQFVSHKVSRWFFAPIALFFLFITNIIIVFQNQVIDFYSIFLVFQILMLILILIGSTLRKKSTRLKIFFIPYYFFIMNYSQVLGLITYIMGNHSVIWEKVNRQNKTEY